MAASRARARHRRAPWVGFTVWLAVTLAAAACSDSDSLGTGVAGNAGGAAAERDSGAPVPAPPADWQAKRLDALMAAGDARAAADLVEREQAYFDRRREDFAPRFARIAAALNRDQIPRLAEALGEMTAVAWPAPIESWPEIRRILAQAADAVAAYDEIALLHSPMFRAPIADTLRLKLAQARHRIKRSTLDRFIVHDHFGTRSFFDLWPLPLDPVAYMTAHIGDLHRTLEAATPDQLERFRALYPKDEVLGADAFARLSDYYLDAVLRGLGGKSTPREKLAAYFAVRALGFAPAGETHFKLLLVDTTAAGAGTPDLRFLTVVDNDVPVVKSLAPEKAALPGAAAVGKADIVILFRIAEARVTRKAKLVDTVPSRYLAGTRTELNPAFVAAREAVIRARDELVGKLADTAPAAGPPASQRDGHETEGGGFLDHWLDFGGGGDDDDADGNGVSPAAVRAPAPQEALDSALDRLLATPPTVETPIYEPYRFDRVAVTVTKSLRATYRVLDRVNGAEEAREYVLSETRRFEVARHLRDSDPDKARHLESVGSERNVTAWETAPMRLALSRLLAHYLKASATTKNP